MLKAQVALDSLVVSATSQAQSKRVHSLQVLLRISTSKSAILLLYLRTSLPGMGIRLSLSTIYLDQMNVSPTHHNWRIAFIY